MDGGFESAPVSRASPSSYLAEYNPIMQRNAWQPVSRLHMFAFIDLKI